jgi:hypothetical protein
MKSSLHSLSWHFFPVIFYCHLLNSTQFYVATATFGKPLNSMLQLPTQFTSFVPKILSRQAGVSKRDSTRLRLLKWTVLYYYFVRTTQKTQPLCCWKGMFQHRCIVKEVTQLLPAYSLSLECVYESLPNNELNYSGFRASCHSTRKV